MSPAKQYVLELLLDKYSGNTEDLIKNCDLLINWLNDWGGDHLSNDEISNYCQTLTPQPGSNFYMNFYDGAVWYKSEMLKKYRIHPNKIK